MSTSSAAAIGRAIGTSGRTGFTPTATSLPPSTCGECVISCGLHPLAFPGMMQLLGCCACCTPDADWGMPLSTGGPACQPAFPCWCRMGFPLKPLNGLWGFPPFSNATRCAPGECSAHPDWELPLDVALHKVGIQPARDLLCAELLVRCRRYAAKGDCGLVNCDGMLAELAVAATARPAHLHTGGGPAEAAHPGLELRALALC